MTTLEKLTIAQKSIRPANPRFNAEKATKKRQILSDGRAEKTINEMTDDITKFVVTLQYHLNDSLAYQEPFAFRQFSFFPEGERIELHQNDKLVGVLSIESTIRRVVENTDLGYIEEF